MRDLIITVVVFGLVPFILRIPRIGAYAWAWLSMMQPHTHAFGFALRLPFSQIVALTTLLGFLFSKKRYRIPFTGITCAYLLFFCWMSITSLFALDGSAAILERWIFVAKIHVMIFLTFMLIRGRKQIEPLIWIMAFSIGFYGVKGGLFTLITGGGAHVWGPPGGVISGNNALGVALVMVIPLMYFLLQQATRRGVRYAIIIAMIMTLFGILGTQSRGALLAVTTMALFLSFKSRKKALTTGLVIGLLAAAALFMPETWTSRMDTIETYDKDMSAMSRIYTWKTLWNLALDRPLIGAGFNADIPIVFQQYAPRENLGAFSFDGTVLVAHSIYFQALGEHGFPGLILYLSIGLLTWRRAGQLARETKENLEFAIWVPLLMRMVQASLAGFAVGGAFLSMVHFDLPYYIVSVVILVDATWRDQNSGKANLGEPSIGSMAFSSDGNRKGSPHSV